MTMIPPSENSMAPQPGMTPGQSARHRMDVSLDGKAPQEAAHYGPATDPSRACQGCASFAAPNQCDLVAGQIRPDGTCDLFNSGQEQPPAPPAAAGPPPGSVPTSMLGGGR